MLKNTRIYLKTAAKIARGRIPGQLIIQMTDHCNASCPHCGMRVSNPFSRRRLPNKDIKQIIDAAAKNGIEAISFTGGEPMLHLDDLVEMINYAGKAGIPFIRTGTNGYFLKNFSENRDKFEARITKIASRLADTPLRNFWISMDSCEPDIHEKMRGLKGVVEGIERALPIFHSFGIYPSVNLGVNRNVGGDLTSELNVSDYKDPQKYLELFRQHYLIAMKRFYRRVIGMGFTMLNTCYPMSIDSEENGSVEAVYAATATDRLVSFSDMEKAVLFDVLMECVAKFRSQIRIFSPMTSLFTLHRHYKGGLPDRHPSFPCRGGIDFFFVDAQKGETFPCGYRGKESMGKYWEIDQSKKHHKMSCRMCDWECFRDPSEQLSLLLQAVSRPGAVWDRIMNDRRYISYWLSDIKYYRACRYFNGRIHPEWKRIERASAFYRHMNPSRLMNPTLTLSQ